MELCKAEAMAKKLINEHCIKPYRFKWHNQKLTLGTCNYQEKAIYLSKFVTNIVDWDTTKDTILHEIAHANVGIGYGHGRVWKREALRLGAKPFSRTRLVKHEQRNYKYKATCPNHGLIGGFYRRPKYLNSGNSYTCRRCGSNIKIEVD